MKKYFLDLSYLKLEQLIVCSNSMLYTFINEPILAYPGHLFDNHRMPVKFHFQYSLQMDRL